MSSIGARIFRIQAAACLAAVLLLVPAVTGTAFQTAEAIVFRGATVIDGTGRPPIAGTSIVIAGDRIAAVGPDAAVAVPSGARVIDAR